MKRIILFLIPVFLIPSFIACSNNGGSQAPGTFELVTTRNGPGPGGPVSLHILIMSTGGTQINRFQTDASGHGSISLAPGSYEWGAADTNWILIQKPDTTMVQEGGTLQRVTVLKWPLVITSGNVTRDTLVFCPLCV